jgi:hypothetical protein
MCKLRALFLICGLAVLGVGAGYADSLTEYFTYGVGIVSSAWQIVPVASEGTITLTTNPGGTITVVLTDNNATINEVGFNSVWGLVEYYVDSTSTINPLLQYGFGDQFGQQYLGYSCSDGSGNMASCGVDSITFTLSASVPLTSVYQLIGGTNQLLPGGKPAYSDFYLNDNNNGDTNGDYLGQYGAGMPPYTPSSSTTPEPGTFLLLATGLAGTLGAIRRKLKA